MAMIGIKAPFDLAEQLKKNSVPGKQLSPEEMHITMFYFEKQLKIKDVITIIGAAHDALKRSGPFQVRGNKITTFPKGDDGVPVIVPIISDELLTIRKRMASKFDSEDIVFSKKYPEYKPHLTLSYATKEMEDEKLDKAVSWKVKDIVLWAGDNMDGGIIVSLPLTKQATRYDLHAVYSDVFEKLAARL
ncbi:MAG TPA: 2'-5' RNA ligase family protein [Paenisporosarcina sp.]|nr:2'-5' RNA ligase family protein [Paenisporosarcina sp.]